MAEKVNIVLVHGAWGDGFSLASRHTHPAQRRASSGCGPESTYFARRTTWTDGPGSWPNRWTARPCWSDTRTAAR